MRIGILVAFATFIDKKKGQCITEIMVAQEAYKKGLKATKCALGLKNLMRQNAIFQNGTTGFLIIITATITTIITAICRANKHFKNNLDCLGFLIVVLARMRSIRSVRCIKQLTCFELQIHNQEPLFLHSLLEK